MTSGTAGYRNAWRSCNTTKDLPPDPKLMLLDELKMRNQKINLIDIPKQKNISFQIENESTMMS